MTTHTPSYVDDPTALFDDQVCDLTVIAAAVLRSLADGFLPPASVHATYRLDQAGLAYSAAESGVAGRPVLVVHPES